MIEQKERRKQTRLNAYHLVKYRLLPSQQAEKVLASLKDISGGGICLRTKEKLPVPAVIQLYISFPKIPQPIPCTAKVKWVKKIGKLNSYDVGIEFVDMEEALRSEISRRIDFVNKKLGKEAQR